MAVMLYAYILVSCCYVWLVRRRSEDCPRKGRFTNPPANATVIGNSLRCCIVVTIDT